MDDSALILPKQYPIVLVLDMRNCQQTIILNGTQFCKRYPKIIVVVKVIIVSGVAQNMLAVTMV